MSHACIEVTNIDANNYTAQYYLLPLATVKIIYFVLYNNPALGQVSPMLGSFLGS